MISLFARSLLRPVRSEGLVWLNCVQRNISYVSSLDPRLNSVLKVYAVASSPNFHLPWQNKAPRHSTGSGFVIDDRKILTNAHVVADATHVRVRRYGFPNPFHARVTAIGHECDLAVLSVEDEEFWTDLTPLEFGGVPSLRDSVTVVGYPLGGDNISITSGVVSRVDVQQYAHAARRLLAVQIDAAINPGNSGGPAFRDDEVVGIAFQNLIGAENVGYVIPIPIVEHFLKEVRNCKVHVGFSSLGVHTQPLHNKHLRDSYGMSKDETGVLVTKVLPTMPSSKTLKKGDIILSIDGHDLANDGSVSFRGPERVSFEHITCMKSTGETCHVKLIRAPTLHGEENTGSLRDKNTNKSVVRGDTIDLEVEMAPIDNHVPVEHFERSPDWYIVGGFVFVTFTQPFLHEYGADWYNQSPRLLCHVAMESIRKEPDHEFVVIAQVLTDEMTVGYENVVHCIVSTLNGIKVKNLRHLANLVDNSDEDFLRFEMTNGAIVVLHRETAFRGTAEILSRHRIPYFCSPCLIAPSSLRARSSQDSVSSTVAASDRDLVDIDAVVSQTCKCNI
eukprot:Rmarinus@m.22490